MRTIFLPRAAILALPWLWPWMSLPVMAEAQAPESLQAKGAAQTAPAPPLQAYRLHLDQMLLYDVAITARRPLGRTNIVQRIVRRELCLFAITPDGQLAMYAGTKKPEPKAQTHQGRSKPPEASAAEPLKPDSPQMIWIRYVLGRPYARNPDGTIEYRPPTDKPMPYPVLPLPPAEVKPNQPFELALADLAEPGNPTMQLVCRWRRKKDGSIAVKGSLKSQPAQIGKTTVQMAVYEYQIQPGSAAVASVREIRRAVLAQSDLPAPATPQTPAGSARQGRSRRRTAQAGSAARQQQVQETVIVVIRLAGTKTLTESQHRGLVDAIEKAIQASGQSQTDETKMLPSKPADQQEDQEAWPSILEPIRKGIESRQPPASDGR